MKILFLTNTPSPYRIDFFNELGKTCELIVIFEKESSTERDDSWKKFQYTNFTPIFLKGIPVRADAAFAPSIIKYIAGQSYDHIICGNYSTPTGILAIQYMKMMKIPYWYEGDGGFVKDGKGLKEKFKRYLMSGAKGYFSPSKEFDKFCIFYGADSKKIYRYPFTSLFSKNILSQPLTPEEKKLLRYKLNIKEKHVVLGVGQFIERKGFDILLKSSTAITKDTAIYFIGGEPHVEYRELVEKLKLKNIYFINFKCKKELNLYYQASDIFVLPTREDIWGLVINEAMANGLPVITTDKCIAGLELVENNVNGYIIPTEESKILAECINKILLDTQLKNQMSKKSLKKIQDYTIENMAIEHIKILRKHKMNYDV